MPHEQDREAVARGFIDSGLYMTLGTADAAGRPWVSPVYYAFTGYSEFLWVSRPDATHSRNLEARPELAIVVFDTTAPIGTGQGVYMKAVAEEVAGPEIDRAIAVFSDRSQEHGGRPWTREDVEPPSHLRLYRASVSAHSLLERDSSERTPVELS
jgi:nitroimidazol reductase NimA-like FMN-containing flavoprotein (pyridoxamine 5'-phosphate oxidase superfamily)